MKLFSQKLWLAASFFISSAFAEDVATGWLNQQEGFREEVIGARLVSIDAVPADGSKRVTLAIPRKAVVDRGNYEEIVVVGRQPDKSETRFEVRYEWAEDYEKDFYGLILYLGKDSNFPIRLYFKSENMDSDHLPP